MNLDDRNRKVLQAVIDSYIASGSPVGSTVLVKRYDFGLSSATLRNIMADLEDMGLLTHPHTSAGRIPTDLGYRYYVDTMISMKNEEEGLEDHLRQTPQLQGDDLHELMEEASRFLASLSHCVGIVAAPAETDTAYKHVEFVRLQGAQVLIIFVTSAGLVQNRLVELDEGIRQQELNEFSAYLDRELGQWSLSDIRRRLLDKMQEEKLVFMQLMDETYRASKDVQERESELVFVGGASHMLDAAEFGDVERMRTLFKAFEDKYKLLKLLDRSVAAQGIKVFIGAENPFFEMQGCSMVIGNYEAGSNVVGTLGVIGPTRMQYRQVIHVVDYTARLLSKLLSERFQRGIER
jgi:heat-inducible transcriptional repressor